MALFRRRAIREAGNLDESKLDTALRSALANNAITAENAMEIPALSAAVNFLAYSVAGLPVKMYKENDGQTTEVANDYRLRLLNRETGDLLDAYEMKVAMVRDYLISGNGYSYVNWVGQRVQGIYYINEQNVSYDNSTDPIFKTGVFYVGGNTILDYKVMRILKDTKDGLSGSGIVDQSSTLLETMYASLKYENRMVKTGSKKGFLKSKQRLKQEMIDALKKAWNKLYSQDSEETVVVLNEGLEFQDAGTTAVDNQLNQNKLTNAEEVYKLLGIVPSVLTGGATSEDVKATIIYGIRPIVRAMETAFNRFLLLENEKPSYSFEIDMDSLDITSILDRYQAYEVAVKNGWMQLDEVRHEEGRNPLGLDFVRLGLDTVIYDPASKNIYTPNTKEWASLEETEKGGGDGDESGDSSGQIGDDD
jgi:HK97 family phage portal protein